MTVNEIERKLGIINDEINSLTVVQQKDTLFPQGALDGHSEGYTVTSYTNPTRVRELMNQKAYYESLLQQTKQNAEDIRVHQENVEKENLKWKEEYVGDAVLKEFSDAHAEYEKKNFFGKAKALFSGKRPKKDMSTKEMVATYGESAVERITSPIIADLEARRAQNIERAKRDFANDPHTLEIAIRQINDSFDNEIAKVSTSYDHTLETLQRDGRIR